MNSRCKAAGIVVIAAALTWLALPSMALGSSLVVIKGRGWGNGVGLSQWGANGFAQHGWGYRRILAHYYPHTTMAVAPDQVVRVLLENDANAVVVGSARPFLLVDSNGQTIHLQPGRLRLSSTFRVGKEALTPPVTVEPGEQPLQLDGAGYRGSFIVSRSAGRLNVVNAVPLERYVRGVVPSEMPVHWSAAAYKAQAVAARSYALANLHPSQSFDLFADNRSQVYGGIASERTATNLAVGATAGKVLTYNDQVVDAYYDSDSGGRTAAVQDVFPTDPPVPYLISVSDPFDGGSPNRRWQTPIALEALSQRFNTPVRDVQVQVNPSGRATAVQLLTGTTTETIPAGAFSTALNLRSTYFTIGVASLNGPTSRSFPGQPVVLSGFLRDLSGVVLQKRTSNGNWVPVTRLVTARNGRFRRTVRPTATTSYRLAVGNTTGAVVMASVSTTPRPLPVASIKIQGP